MCWKQNIDCQAILRGAVWCGGERLIVRQVQRLWQALVASRTNLTCVVNCTGIERVGHFYRDWFLPSEWACRVDGISEVWLER